MRTGAFVKGAGMGPPATAREEPVVNSRQWHYSAAMVRPESCTVPAGGSPVRVSAGAPGSRHQPWGETPGAGGCVKSLLGGSEEAGRNTVTAAASTHYQPKGVREGRAAHVTAKATYSAPVPERALGLPGGL